MLVSGRHLSRAWQAVASAASDDEGRPQLYRAVHVEQYPKGLRLVATDSHWLAQCWVPSSDADLGDLEPRLGELPDDACTIVDDEYRIRDLMKFVAKATKKEGADDIDVRLDFTLRHHDPATPTLTPEMAPARVRFEIPDERIMARTINGPWPNWRHLVADFERLYCGAETVVLSAWMLRALAKVAAAGAGPAIRVDWVDDQRAVWTVSGSSLDFVPHGILMGARSNDPAPAAEPVEDAVGLNQLEASLHPIRFSKPGVHAWAILMPVRCDDGHQAWPATPA